MERPAFLSEGCDWYGIFCSTLKLHSASLNFLALHSRAVSHKKDFPDWRHLWSGGNCSTSHLPSEELSTVPLYRLNRSIFFWLHFSPNLYLFCLHFSPDLILTLAKFWNRMTASVLKQEPNTERFERRTITTRTHSMHIFGEIPFVKPQNDTWTTVKRLKTMENEKETDLFLVDLLSFVGRL